MRYSEFWSLVDDVFGVAYGRTLAATQVLTGLGSRTAQEALDAGVDPRRVWHELCDAMDVPEPERWGADRHRQAPPRGGHGG